MTSLSRKSSAPASRAGRALRSTTAKEYPIPDVDPPDPQGTGFRPPRLEGRHVYLRPISPSDYDSLRRAELSKELGLRWRFRGGTPGPERWAQEIWANTLAQFLVISRAHDAPIGLVAVHNHNFQDGHARLSVARLGAERHSPALMFGCALFIQYVFHCWDFRKLYMDVPEYNYKQFASGLDRYFVMEGRLRDDMFAAGRYWDQIILAIYRDQWLEQAESVLAFETPS